MILLMLSISMLPIMAQEKVDNLPGNSVYADTATQDRIASLISEIDLKNLERKGICILKRSITPVYYADPLEFLEKGTWTIYPSKIEYPDILSGANLPACGEIGEQPKIFVAKAISYEGDPSCDVELWLNDNHPRKAPYVSIKFITSDGNFSRTSFYDHVAEINSCLPKNGHASFDETHFRYVRILGIESGKYGRPDYYDYGSVFLYKNKNQEAIINLDAYNGLFFDEESDSRCRSVLNNEEALKKFAELKEMRDFQLQYKKNIDDAGGQIVNFSFESYYTILTGRYLKTRHAYNVICISEFSISDFLSTGKGDGTVKYPEAKDLIGTRGDPYAIIDWGIETEGVTETVAETPKITENNEQSESNAILWICGITGAMLIIINIGAIVIFKKKKSKETL